MSILTKAKPKPPKALAADGEASALQRGGRPKLFEEPTVRLNLSLPEQTAKIFRHLAVEEGLSLSQLVDGWVRKAEMDHALARGSKALLEGRVVDQTEAEKRLARWG